MRYPALFLISLLLLLIVARFQPWPGYMDADYYFAGGLNLIQGRGFSELFLWNYLDDPTGLPHPSHAYWMPLASLVAAAGMGLAGSAGFQAARWPFLLLAACLPPLTARLAWSLTLRRSHALTAALLALFPGYYLAFLPTTDTFGIYMALGACFFLLLGSAPSPGVSFGLGLLAGGFHLARADGLLWLPLAGLAVWQSACVLPLRRRAWWLLAAGTGYLLVMGPWLARNWLTFGAPLAPGGSRALWLTHYDQMFSYPADVLTPAFWLASGWNEILRIRLQALGLNLLTAWGVQGLVILAPFTLLGAWALRADPRVRLGGLAWLLTLAAMTIAFPFAGARGGFLHSGAALQPLFLVLVPVGLERALLWMERRRGWDARRAFRVFAGGLVGLAVLASAFLVFTRVIGPDPARPLWGRAEERLLAVEQFLRARGAPADAVVIVSNPPGYFIVSGRPAIALPDGDLSTLLQLAADFDARFLVLQAGSVSRGLRPVYAEPALQPGLRYLGEIENARLFELALP